MAADREDTEALRAQTRDMDAAGWADTVFTCQVRDMLDTVDRLRADLAKLTSAVRGVRDNTEDVNSTGTVGVRRIFFEALCHVLAEGGDPDG